MSTKISSAKGVPRSTNIAGRTPNKSRLKPPTASVAGPRRSAYAVKLAASLNIAPAQKQTVTPVKASSITKKTDITTARKTPKAAPTAAASCARRPLPISRTIKPKVAMTRLPLPSQKVPLKTSPKEPKMESLVKERGEPTTSSTSSQEQGIQTDEAEILDHSSIEGRATVLLPSRFVVAEIERSRQANPQLQLVPLRRPMNLPEQDDVKPKCCTTISFHERVMEVHRSMVCVVDHADNQTMPNDFNNSKMDDGVVALQGSFRRI